MAMNIKKGDTIVVLSGKDKGKQGKVLGTVPKSTKIVAEGINMVTCHVKPCPKCNKGTRVAHKIEGGKKIRVCKHCGAEL